jgi:acylpyruvate hydrolase
MSGYEVSGQSCKVAKAPVMSGWWQNTRTIYCIGRNYVAHAHELGNAVPTAPFWFLKPASAIIPSGSEHHCFPGRQETHHELELGVVIGVPASRVTPENALEHVAGYCLALDMTDREGQDIAKKAGKPWTQAKGWDTSCPVSDMVPACRVPDPSKLNMWLKVNGEENPRQAGPTSNMIFGVPELIAEISKVHTLQVGDLILTGTPEGVGPVKPGDVIEAGITELNLGLTTTISHPL